ncbi:Tc5 transposase DNA-binding domain [Popillia japonica]|uniref:Tc5 transposase DNA-binding domain n=1 Tax=Popillia japonica TaxID=7064 RepID=A0AAW1LAX3_POPJA
MPRIPPLDICFIEFSDTERPINDIDEEDIDENVLNDTYPQDVPGRLELHSSEIPVECSSSQAILELHSSEIPVECSSSQASSAVKLPPSKRPTLKNRKHIKTTSDWPDKKHLLYRLLHTRMNRSLVEWATIDEGNPTEPKTQRSTGIPITGPILQAKAIDFGKLLGLESWIKRFRNRHSIAGGTVSDESASVSESTNEEWLKNRFAELRKNYTDEQIFNADETELSYKMTANKTLKFKGEKCSGDKMSKDRVPVLVVANMTGTIKKTACHLEKIWKNQTIPDILKA